MADKIITCSVWAKGDKKMKLFSKWEKGSREKRFYCTGHNPFPCFTMESTYYIIEGWLKANGWERQTGGFISTCEEIDCGGKVYKQTTMTRFVPFAPAR